MLLQEWRDIVKGMELIDRAEFKCRWRTIIDILTEEQPDKIRENFFLMLFSAFDNRHFDIIVKTFYYCLKPYPQIQSYLLKTCIDIEDYVKKFSDPNEITVFKITMEHVELGTKIHPGALFTHAFCTDNEIEPNETFLKKIKSILDIISDCDTETKNAKNSLEADLILKLRNTIRDSEFAPNHEPWDASKWDALWEEALDEHKKNSKPIEGILIKKGLATREEVDRLIQCYYQAPPLEFSPNIVQKKATKLVAKNICFAYQVIPFDFDPRTNTLKIAAYNPRNVIKPYFSLITKKQHIEIYYADWEKIKKAIKICY